MQELYDENYKTLIYEIKEPNKWGDIPYSWIEILNIVKVSVLSNLIYRLSAVPLKSWQMFFVNIDKLIPKFCGV